MRLVGATRWYTQLPFLLEAAVTGVVGYRGWRWAACWRASRCSWTRPSRTAFGDGVIPIVGYGGHPGCLPVAVPARRWASPRSPAT